MGRDEFDALGAGEVVDLLEAWRRREQRADHRFGVLATVIAEVNRDARRRPHAFEPADFFGSLEPAPRGGWSEEDLLAQMELYAGRAGISGG